MVETLQSIVEERECLMVPPTGGNHPTRRSARFIKPTISGHKNETFTNLKSQPLHPPTSNSDNQPLTLSMKVKFLCRESSRKKKWESWVAKMVSLHEPTWKKAGIFGAVLSSTYKIDVDKDFILGFAEKWCSETKSFIFPWGEASITLEDVMVLGSFSVLGSPVFAPLKTEDLEVIAEELESARRQIVVSFHKAFQHLWMEKFMESNSKVEHEAFLALWLSRFVFPSPYSSIDELVIPIAVHLARGTRIALAPAVLAHIYRDLSTLKKFSQRVRYKKHKVVLVNSPFGLVQVWGWERFPGLGPNPNVLNNGDPRLARWHNLKSKKAVSFGEGFDWRPYAKTLKGWYAPEYYRSEEGFWVSVASNLDNELLAFALSMRVSHLVGLDCVEKYLPNRIGLQFGMDQDIPEDIAISYTSHQLAWDDFVHTGGGKMYVPPRLFKGDVTVQYVDWWRQLISMRSTCLEKEVHQNLVAWGVRRKRPKYASNASNGLKSFPRSHWANVEVKQEITSDHLPVPPGFPPKCNDSLETKVAAEEDNRKHGNVKKHRKLAASSTTELATFSSNKSKQLPYASLLRNPQEGLNGQATCPKATDDKSIKELNDSPFPPGFPPTCTSFVEKKHTSDDLEGSKICLPTLEIENRISTLEREVAMLKAAILGKPH